MSEQLLKLSKEQILKIINKGYTEVLLPWGEVKIITKDDLVFKKDEVEAFEKRLKEEKI